MKTRLFVRSLLAGTLLLISNLNYGQAPPLGTTADFVLYTSVGAMVNVGTYQYLTLLTGNVGTNSGPITNFGNVNGVMHTGDGATTSADADLIIARDFLVAAIHDSAIVNPVLGKDSTYMAGTYLLPNEAVSLNLSLTLDAQGDPNAVFIFKMAAIAPVYAFSTSANAKVKLINGAQACNVYWYISGAVSMAAGTSMKGTIISGGAIDMAAGDTLEGRALTTAGGVTVDNGDIGFLGYLPVDISTPLPTGPAAPVFVESKEYAIFSSIGNVTDDGTSHVDGSVGGNSALPTGFNPLFVTGNIDGMNPATAGAAADLLLVYNSLNTLTADIELLAPPQFGHNLVLTPNTYLMNGAVTFTDTVFMDGFGNPDAVFIIKTYGAFASGVNSRVVLMNGTQAKNVYWMVNGAVSIGDGSIFNGNIIANNGAIDLLTGATLNGRALTTDGAISVTAMNAILPYPPFVITDPVGLTVCEGDSAGFTVEATGSGTFTYQWRKGTVNLIDGGNISGVTNDTLIIDPVSTSDAASNYNVIVYGSIEPNDTSVNATLVVNTSPAITTQPANQIECAGDPASFSVVATGAGLTYQWRKGIVNLVDGITVTGATTATLTLDPIVALDAAANYNVVITGSCTPPVTSANASLTVNSAPAITTQPTNQIECAGSPASFSVVATGTSLTYQWRKGLVNLTNGGNVTGATTATLTLDPVALVDAAVDYNVVITGTCLPAVTSANASLTVNPVLPAGVSVAADANPVCTATTVAFTATPTNGGATPVYQWYKNTIAVGTNSAIYTYVPVTGDAVYVIMTSSLTCTSGSPATSNTVTMTVNSDLPAGVSVVADANPVCTATTVAFTATPTNGGAIPVYQWYKNTVAVGTNSATYTYVPVTGDAVYVIMTSSLTCTTGSPATSNTVTMVVNSDLPAGVSVTADANPVCTATTVAFTATPTNGGATPVYQWYKNTVAVGTNSATYTYVPVTGDAVYVIMTSSLTCTSGSPATSNTVTMVVNSDLPAGVSVAADANPVCTATTVAFTATPTNGGAIPVYQWYKNTIAVGTNSATYTYVPVTGDAVYVIMTSSLTCTSGSPATSNTVTMTVNSDLPAGVSVAADANPVCTATTVAFTATPTNGGAIPVYQWYKNTIAVGTNSATYTYVPVTGDAVYVIMTSSLTCTSGSPATSNTVTMTVNADLPAGVSVAADANPVCTATTVAFTATPTNGGAIPVYQWYKNTIAVGTNSATYTYIPVTGDAVYVIMTSSLTCTSGSPATSNTVTMVVNSDLPAGVSVAADANPVCTATTVAFTATPTNGGAIPVYQWYKNTIAVGTNSAIYTYVPVTGDAVYVIMTSSLSCTTGSPATSNTVTMVINSAPAITTQPANQSVNEAESASFTVVATGTALTYQWKKGTVNLTNVGNVSGATSATLTINPVALSDAATDYNVVVSGTCEPSVTSVNASLVVGSAGSVITIQPVNAVSCSGSAVIFSVTAVGTNLTYQWKKGTVNIVNGGTVSGATSATLIIDPVTILDVATNYNVVVSKSLAPVDTSDFIALVLNEVPVITSAPVTQTSCAGILSTFSVTATGTDLTYQWRKGTVDLVDGGNISGATTNTLTINPVTEADGATNYNVVVSGACLPSVTSANVSLEITPDGIDQFVFGTTGNLIKVYPNPFTNSINIIINDELLTNMKGAYELAVYDALGSLVKHTTLVEKVTTIETFELKSGFYFYKVTDNEILIQTGKLISK